MADNNTRTDSTVTNYLVMNQGLNPLVNYNFMLRVEGIYDLPCKAIHSFTKENEFEYIQEGGLNDYVHMRRKPITKPCTFTVERYVGIDYFDPISLGKELVLPLILLVTRYGNHFEVTKRAYVFTGCTVISKEYGELNSERSGLLTEKTVIAYREMMVVTMPGDIPIGNWMEKTNKLENKFAQKGVPVEKAKRRTALPIEKPKVKIVNKLHRKWPVKSSAKTYIVPVKTETPQEELIRKRKELIENLLKVRQKNKELAERRARMRRWPKQSSAHESEDTGKVVTRTVMPIKANENFVSESEKRSVLPIKAKNTSEVKPKTFIDFKM